ncbi:multicopper oxidase domain-containing protein [Ditylenchus destructor]|uniref:Multicopper oxidase domain-containing protein n=1 Tax=Ditylenchus destructor TaxID=166010 RepID=A0AAD4NCL9_9BILA|nr:multicopper oxidase domain-containing protein [Ditylenchus destructor]
MAIPNKYGIYEFELVLEHRLTMSRTLPNRQAGVMDYNPETSSWTQRDASLFTECARNYTIVHSDDNALKKIEVLDDLGNCNFMHRRNKDDISVQHTGKHWRIVTINGQSPGETIVVPLGAQVIMHVKNRLHTEAVTVHLHGVDKRNMWYTDGVAMVQQCPIHPGSE